MFYVPKVFPWPIHQNYFVSLSLVCHSINTELNPVLNSLWYGWIPGKVCTLASDGLKLILTAHTVSFTMAKLLTSNHPNVNVMFFILDLSDLTKQDVIYVKFESWLFHSGNWAEWPRFPSITVNCYVLHSCHQRCLPLELVLVSQPNSAQLRTTPSPLANMGWYLFFIKASINIYISI